MTQEEKELLLKDLCARLPYGVMMKGVNDDFVLGINTPPKRLSYVLNSSDFKPYLRPISSMMQGEWESMTALIYPHGRVNCNKNELLLWLSMDGNDMPISLMEDVFTWLNRHHFDYRGLIPKGLALEAPEDMYKI